MPAVIDEANLVITVFAFEVYAKARESHPLALAGVAPCLLDFADNA
jgi:hypothetical protein